MEPDLTSNTPLRLQQSAPTLHRTTRIHPHHTHFNSWIPKTDNPSATMSAHPETSLLAPLDPQKPSDRDPDQWPEFDITNARITSAASSASASSSATGADTAELVSLLTATEHHPLTLTGSLQPVPPELQSRYIGQSTRRAETIEVRDVRIFAYGQYADGNVALWAAGRCGWYTLKPARAYRSIYNTMAEGVKMLYFIADAYREDRERTVGMGRAKTVEKLPPYTAEEIFAKYAADVLDDADAVDAAREKMESQRDFLLTCVLGGKEGLRRKRNPLFRYLEERYKPDLDVIIGRTVGPGKKNIAARHRRQQSLDSTSESSTLKRKRGRPGKNSDADTDMLEVISVHSSSAGSAAPRIFGSQRGEGVKVGRPTSSRASQTSKAKETSTATALAIQRTRQNSSETNSQTHPGTAASPNPAITPIPEASDSEDEARREARKGRSSLRLKPSAPVAGKASKGGKSATAKGVKGKAPAFAGQEDEHDDDHMEAESSGDELSSSPTIKRKSDTLAPGVRPAKRRGSRHSIPDVGIDDEGIAMPLTPSASEPASPPAPDAVLGAYDEPISDDLVDRLKHAPDPIQQDTWVCALDGCTHKVYLASQPASQKLIREHYALHAYDDDERVQMVKGLKAPSLPVGHLMERVRLQAKVEGFPSSRGEEAEPAGSRFPGVLARRY
ncbi:hypothetical protein B0A50_07625 [Salinomyces thailandicus]|uniref:DNA (cytosine-5)-methyltransferase 1 replication foci domain-containing protein n=1 Tax=Salinomyces thailandicus TaxID=706561 RepID=A0A4U0TN83_9PEZI|nr:hypothetical protein B0A50_07625 [Salinomyces thailandica]